MVRVGQRLQLPHKVSWRAHADQLVDLTNGKTPFMSLLLRKAFVVLIASRRLMAVYG